MLQLITITGRIPTIFVHFVVLKCNNSKKSICDVFCFYKFLWIILIYILLKPPNLLLFILPEDHNILWILLDDVLWQNSFLLDLVSTMVYLSILRGDMYLCTLPSGFYSKFLFSFGKHVPFSHSIMFGQDHINAFSIHTKPFSFAF